jgi:molybdopterin synthase sulfur carrier subunit
MRWKLFADLAERADGRAVDVPVEADEPTVGDALDALLEAHPALRDRVFDDDGRLREHINVLHNGATVESLDERVDPDDELALFPPVSGG